MKVFVCIYVHICVFGACGGQRKALDSLEMLLQTAVSHQVSARSQTQTLYKSRLLLTAEPSHLYPHLIFN